MSCGLEFGLPVAATSGPMALYYLRIRWLAARGEGAPAEPRAGAPAAPCDGRCEEAPASC